MLLRRKWLTMLTLACAAAIWGRAAAAGQLYKAAPGPLEVGFATNLELHDPARGKDLPVRVTYPEGEGPFPVIVFSHGAWASKDFYVPLAIHWASHGYVVVQPTHEDSVSLGKKFGDPSVFSPHFWQARVDDIKLCIDSLEALGIPRLAGKIDHERIGVGGHSYGANTAMAIAGVTFYGDGGKGRTVGDPRVRAVLGLSGQGLGASLTKESWKSVTIPMLVITGTRDPGRGGQSYEWRIDPFTYASPPDKYLLVIEGADHSFGGVTDTDNGPPRIGGRDLPRVEAHVQDVESATTAFWDAYLLGDPDARAFLAAGNIDTLTGGEAAVTAK